MRALTVYTLAYAVIMETMIAVAILYWPDLEKHVDVLRLLIPFEALKDMLSGVVPYVTGQQFFKAGNTLGTAAAILFSVGAVAGEAHRGTLEILLARPYSRLRILTGRYVAGAVGVVTPIFATSATIPALGRRVGEDLDLAPLMLCSAHQGLFLLAIYSLSFLLSAMGSNPIRIALFLLFVSTFQFSVYFVEVVTTWSLFRLADMHDFQRIYDTGSLDWRTCGPLLVFSIAAYAASYLVFRQRVP